MTMAALFGIETAPFPEAPAFIEHGFCLPATQHAYRERLAERVKQMEKM